MQSGVVKAPALPRGGTPKGLQTDVFICHVCANMCIVAYIIEVKYEATPIVDYWSLTNNQLDLFD